MLESLMRILKIWCLVLLLPTGVWAQGGLEGSLTNEKDLKLSLVNMATRTYGRMDKIETKPGDLRQYYSLRLLNQAMSDLDPSVRALKMQQAKVEKELLGNYVKAGFGNFVTPYLEAFLNSKQSEKYSYGFHLRHLSSRNGPIDGPNSGNSFNNVGAYGKLFVKGGELATDLGYDRRVARFYGYGRREPVPTADDIRQTYQVIRAALSYRNTNEGAPFKYKADADFYRLSDAFTASENQLGLGIDGKYALNQESHIQINTRFVFLNHQDTAISRNRNYLIFHPTWHYAKDGLRARVGFQAAYNQDTTAGQKQFYAYPDLQVSYELLENRLQIFGGIVGQFRPNTLRAFSEENPFLGRRLGLAHSSQAAEFQAGLQAAPVERLSVRLTGGIGYHRYMPFFLNQLQDTSRFGMVYDRDVRLSKVAGELSYVLAGVNLSFRSEYNSYTVSDLDAAWHRPVWINSFNGVYKYRDKVLLHLNLYHFGGIRTQNLVSGTRRTLDDIVDLNLKIDYYFSPKVSAFIAANNILSREYQRYLYYPVRGFNGMIGASFAF